MLSIMLAMHARLTRMIQSHHVDGNQPSQPTFVMPEHRHVAWHAAVPVARVATCIQLHKCHRSAVPHHAAVLLLLPAVADLP